MAVTSLHYVVMRSYTHICLSWSTLSLSKGKYSLFSGCYLLVCGSYIYHWGITTDIDVFDIERKVHILLNYFVSCSFRYGKRVSEMKEWYQQAVATT